MWEYLRNKHQKHKTPEKAGKEEEMRMNMNKTASEVKNQKDRKKNRAKGSSFQQNPFVNLKDESSKGFRSNNRKDHADREDGPNMAEIMGSLMKVVFDREIENSSGPVIGVIDFDSQTGFRIDVQENGKKQNMHEKKTGPAVPAHEGCGEEVFQEMLKDLHFMATRVLEADHMLKMVCEADVNPEDARSVTYMGICDAREVLRKWDIYRKCEI